MSLNSNLINVTNGLETLNESVDNINTSLSGKQSLIQTDSTITLDTVKANTIQLSGVDMATTLTGKQDKLDNNSVDITTGTIDSESITVANGSSLTAPTVNALSKLYVGSFSKIDVIYEIDSKQSKIDRTSALNIYSLNVSSGTETTLTDVSGQITCETMIATDISSNSITATDISSNSLSVGGDDLVTAIDARIGTNIKKSFNPVGFSASRSSSTSISANFNRNTNLWEASRLLYDVAFMDTDLNSTTDCNAGNYSTTVVKEYIQYLFLVIGYCIIVFLIVVKLLKL